MIRCAWIIDSMCMDHRRAPPDVPVRCGPVAHEDRVGRLARAGVASRERNADLSVTCSEPVMFQLDMDWRLGRKIP